MVEVITLSSSPPATPVRFEKATTRKRPKTSQCQDFDEFSDFLSDAVFDFGRQGGTPSITTADTPVAETRGDNVPVTACSRRASSRSNGLVVQTDGTAKTLALSDSIFDDVDFLIDQPTKKRKLSQDLPAILKVNSVAEADEVFDLSSELDHVALNACELHAVEDHSVDGNFDLSITAAPILELPDLAQSTLRSRNKDRTFDVLSDDVVLAADTTIDASRSTQRPKTYKYSAKTAALLENTNMTLKDTTSAIQASYKRFGTVKSYAKATKSNKAVLAMEDADNILDSSPVRADLLSKENGKRAQKELKTAERDATKERKKREKEQKAVEKQRAADIAEVNKKKTNKKDSTQEMIVDLPMTMRNKSLGNKVEAEIQNLSAELSYYVDEIDMTADGSSSKSLGNIIKWRRKVASTYDQQTEEWVPLAHTKIIQEKHILVHLTAEDFCSIAAAGPSGQRDETLNSAVPNEEVMQGYLDMYVAVLRSRYPDCTIVMMIEGLTLWLKKHVNAKNREYVAAVRAQPNSVEPTTVDNATASQRSAPSSRASKKRKSSSSVDLSFINSDVAESLLLHLQICHQPLRIHQTIQSESWEQIVAFTQHLSTRPYRNVELERNIAHASFCMTSGQFRTGQGDPLDTWVKMLEQVNRLTVSMAQGIVNEGYESPAQLAKAFKKTETRALTSTRDLNDDARANREGKELAKVMLQDVNRARSDQRLGPAVSKRLYKIFTSQDEDLRDGIA